MSKDMLKQISEDTAIGRAVTQAVTTAGNLRQILTCPHWSALGRPLQGETAYIVGAGPSLDKNIEELAGCRLGAVFAVNTSAPALRRAGIPIDVLATVEPVDIAGHMGAALEDPDTLVALDLIASPGAWAAARGHRRVWFTGMSPEALEVCTALDLPPLCHGGAAVTAAFMLAYEWGASTIVLLGHDLAYGEAAPYAKGSGWDGLELHREGDRLVFTGRPDRDEAHTAAGVPKLPRNRPAIEVPSWDGEGMVQTVLDYYSQIDWYQRHAHLSRVLVNATEGGARLQGWEHTPLADVDEGAGGGEDLLDAHKRAEPVPEQAVEAMLTSVLARLDATEGLAKLLRAQESPRGAAGLVEGASDFVGFAAQSELIGMERAGLPMATRLDGLYCAYEEAARQIREAIVGTTEGRKA